MSIRALGLEERTCPACHKIFRTCQGRNSHLRHAGSCSWYRLGKLKALDVGFEPQEPAFEGYGFGGEHEPGRGSAYPEELMVDLPEEDFFHFIPSQQEEEGGDSANQPEFVQGSSRSVPRALGEEDDTRMVDEYMGAGKVIRMGRTLHERWRETVEGQGLGEDADGDIEMNTSSGPDKEQQADPPCSYIPFASALDWRIARWFIQDQPGHKAFDRFLQIPGVSVSECI